MTHPVLNEAAVSASEVLMDLEATLERLTDGQLHLADPDGGWTCAQVVSHISLSGLVLIAALERLRHRTELFIFREELGHDAVGAVPATAKEAARRVASLRLALHDCLQAADPSVLTKNVEVPPFGIFTFEQGLVPIVSHLGHHRDQVNEILRKRGVASG
jgi:hypothetical protein